MMLTNRLGAAVSISNLYKEKEEDDRRRPYRDQRGSYQRPR
jgi:hypothetical protein